MSDQVWIVWAVRGEYSSQTEYAVCWYPTEDEAQAAAGRMFVKSCEMQSWAGDDIRRWNIGQQEVGDPCWSPSDETKYSTYRLPRGSKP